MSDATATADELRTELNEIAHEIAQKIANAALTTEDEMEEVALDFLTDLAGELAGWTWTDVPRVYLAANEQVPELVREVRDGFARHGITEPPE